MSEAPRVQESWPGEPYPLGATYDGAGTNFSLFSEVAEQVELCLFIEDGTESRLELDEVDAFCWHAPCRLIGWQRYGYNGPWNPGRRRRFNPPSWCSSVRPGHRARVTGHRLYPYVRRRGLAQSR
jgi:pullulanase/glycogen debranching enzyme